MKHLLRLAGSLIREHLKRVTRSPKWRAVEKAHLTMHPSCAACGSDKHVQVHHKAPFHLHPEKELEPQNLISLCMDKLECHLHVGHGGDWKAWNPRVLKDAAEFLNQVDRRQAIVDRARKERHLA